MKGLYFLNIFYFLLASERFLLFLLCLILTGLPSLIIFSVEILKKRKPRAMRHTLLELILVSEALSG